MKKELDELMSAMVDGELDASHRSRVTDALIDNAPARQAWQRYHLMRDTLRNNLPDEVTPALFDRVRNAISQEPTHQIGGHAKIDNHARVEKKSLFAFGFQPAYGFVAAAALVVAVVTVTQIERSATFDLPTLAQLDAQPNTSPETRTPFVAADALPMVNHAQLSVYLANHTVRSRSYPMHDGLLPYVRSAKFQDRR
ncbi:MAG: sigma-E factor negative regulatory protein [Gammaproteobacteria bacterium]|nr:sigma-E factor negative regulatory protein [Gammaproteobacteria bacterium]